MNTLAPDDFNLDQYGLYLRSYNLDHDFSSGDLATINFEFAFASGTREGFIQLTEDLKLAHKYFRSNNPQVQDLIEKIKIITELTDK